MNDLTLVPGKWVGLSAAPARRAIWPHSPAYVVELKALKSGKGTIHLSIIVPLQPCKPLVVDGVFRVLSRSDSMVVLKAVEGSAAENIGEILLLELLSRVWMERHWPDLLQRSFPPPSYMQQETVEDLVSQIFGRDSNAILTGATEASFSSKNGKMPKLRVTVPFVRTFEGLDACLIRNGYIPQEMEDKWFIHRKGSQLLFRRSWSGVLFYAADIREEPGRVIFDRVTINRDPKHHAETDTVQDLVDLAGLIDRLLLGRHGQHLKGDRDILQAWGIGEKAILQSP